MPTRRISGGRQRRRLDRRKPLRLSGMLRYRLATATLAARVADIEAAKNTLTEPTQLLLVLRGSPEARTCRRQVGQAGRAWQRLPERSDGARVGPAFPSNWNHECARLDRRGAVRMLEPTVH